MEQSQHKQRAAEAALAYAEQVLPEGATLGVGTGTTAAAFIALVPRLRDRLAACVASSEATRGALLALGLRVVPLPSSGPIALYVDGADVVTPELVMLKGGGGAHTREKRVAAAAAEFVCIADESKLAPALHGVVPVEVEAARLGEVTATLQKLGVPRLRAGFTTDGGNPILDVEGLSFSDPLALETELEAIDGVVACGVFARRRADRLYLAGDAGVRLLLSSPR